MSDAVRVVVISLGVLSCDDSVIVSSVINRLIWPLTWDSRSVILVLDSTFCVRLLQSSFADVQDGLIIGAIVDTLRPWSSPGVSFHRNVHVVILAKGIVKWPFFPREIEADVVVRGLAQDLFGVTHESD